MCETYTSVINPNRSRFQSPTKRLDKKEQGKVNVPMNFEQTPSSNFLLLNQATTSSTLHSLGGEVGLPPASEVGDVGIEGADTAVS